MAEERGVTYVKLDGDIGILGNGAGLVMSTLDVVALAGGRPANFLDAGGGSKADEVVTALEVLLSDEKVKALLVNIFGGITRCDEVAEGLLTALEQLGDPDRRAPGRDERGGGAPDHRRARPGQRRRGADDALRRAPGGRARRAGGPGVSILVDDSTKLLVQGITGREGAFHATRNKAYGTQVVAGVTPGKGGQEVDGIPVFDTSPTPWSRRQHRNGVRPAPPPRTRSTRPPTAASTWSSPSPRASRRTTCCASTPICGAAARPCWARTARGHQPGVASVGIMPTQVFAPGRVGLVSRSGTLTYQISKELALLGIGQSTVVGIGGDPVVGSSFIDVLERFEADPETDLAVMVGEIGGRGGEGGRVHQRADADAGRRLHRRLRRRQRGGPRGRDHHRLLGHGPGQKDALEARGVRWAPTPPRWPRSHRMSLARADGGEGFRLERVREVVPLLDEWAALADRVAAPAPLEPGYLAAWAEAYSATERLIAVTARRDGELAAVLPIVLFDRASRRSPSGPSTRSAWSATDPRRRTPRWRAPCRCPSPGCCCGGARGGPPTGPGARPRGPGSR